MSTYDEIFELEPTDAELEAIDNEFLPDWAWDEYDPDDWYEF